ncbi:hypothetical protein E2P81_ATG01217 [Venturia nashicola]|uniref:Uncharacterized protein n=1 Tax=Venturia nashicola TaxID=86259 RepID=A0A4Z1PBK8_9PEZI|nr:hypothetical protein E6O75_ATG01245 [Venturia nashicola]TLD38674.1 hypothetical protein E2P81_ATG01217 [Venturia nashicola]
MARNCVDELTAIMRTIDPACTKWDKYGVSPWYSSTHKAGLRHLTKTRSSRRGHLDVPRQIPRSSSALATMMRFIGAGRDENFDSS